MLINKENIREIIEDCNCRPDKDFGQNFLVEPTICESIVNLLNINEEDDVLEVGPGVGSLTHFLTLKSKRIDVVDVDSRMCDFISFAYKNQDLKVINDDIRKVDVSKYSKIIGNLPYNITTDLVQYILTNSKCAKKIVLMCQSETLNHFTNTEGSEYGPTSVLIHLMGSIKKELVVKAGSFIPAPKCSSTVFSITINSGLNYDDAIGAFFLAKNLFLNRRKTIYNNLSVYLKNKELAANVLKDVGINSLNRPEQLSPAKFLNLYKAIQNR